MEHYKNIKQCRVCGSKKMHNVLSLGSLYLTGVFPRGGAA